MIQSEVIIRTTIENDPLATLEEKTRVLAALNPHNPTKDTWLTTKQAAVMLECHVVTLRRYEKAGRITPVRISPRKIRWSKRAVERLMFQGMEVV